MRQRLFPEQQRADSSEGTQRGASINGTKKSAASLLTFIALEDQQQQQVSMLPTVPGMLVLVEYSNDEIRPMVATALQHFLHSTG